MNSVYRSENLLFSLGNLTKICFIDLTIYSISFWNRLTEFYRRLRLLWPTLNSLSWISSSCWDCEIRFWSRSGSSKPPKLGRESWFSFRFFRLLPRFISRNSSNCFFISKSKIYLKLLCNSFFSSFSVGLYPMILSMRCMLKYKSFLHKSKSNSSLSFLTPCNYSYSSYKD